MESRVRNYPGVGTAPIFSIPVQALNEMIKTPETNGTPKEDASSLPKEDKPQDCAD